MKNKNHVDILQRLTSTRWMKPNRRRFKLKHKPDPFEVYVNETIEELTDDFTILKKESERGDKWRVSYNF